MTQNNKLSVPRKGWIHGYMDIRNGYMDIRNPWAMTLQTAAITHEPIISG